MSAWGSTLCGASQVSNAHSEAGPFKSLAEGLYGSYAKCTPRTRIEGWANWLTVVVITAHSNIALCNPQALSQTLFSLSLTIFLLVKKKKKSNYHPIFPWRKQTHRGQLFQDHRARKWQIGVYTDISLLGLCSLCYEVKSEARKKSVSNAWPLYL